MDLAQEKEEIAHIEVVQTPVSNVQNIKLDGQGLPLVPQPSDDPEDPLNWPLWLKCAVLTQAALLGALGNLKYV